jgi:outer membrane receptor protein involved in Fe transport
MGAAVVLALVADQGDARGGCRSPRGPSCGRKRRSTSSGDTSWHDVALALSAEHPPPSYNVFDVSGRYTFADRWELRFGVDNLLDEEPPIVNLRTVAEGYTQTGVTNAAFYDVLGRRYYVGMTVPF